MSCVDCCIGQFENKAVLNFPLSTNMPPYIQYVHTIPESLISSSEATLTLISWLSKLFLDMGLPSLGFNGPGRSAAAAAPAGPSWQNVAGKLGWTWLWDWEEGLGLKASSALGSSFRWNGDLSVSLWLAAAARLKRSRRILEKEFKESRINHDKNTGCDQT